MSSIKPIETRYAGCTFRSRLEARWAVFFDKLGVEWEYEPEGFELTDDTWYLPDFRIQTSFGLTYLEVKPTEPSAEEARKLREVAAGTCRYAIFLVGSPGKNPLWHVDASGEIGSGNFEPLFSGANHPITNIGRRLGCPHLGDLAALADWTGCGANLTHILSAASAARSHRFERRRAA